VEQFAGAAIAAHKLKRLEQTVRAIWRDSSQHVGQQASVLQCGSLQEAFDVSQPCGVVAAILQLMHA
jgi:hypothetical protein